jgi:hypothetical protein
MWSPEVLFNSKSNPDPSTIKSPFSFSDPNLDLAFLINLFTKKY